MCVWMGSTSEELCWLLTHILSPASSHGTDPGRMSRERSLIPAHTPAVSVGQGAPRGPSWGWGSAQLHTHTHAKALTHEPEPHQIQGQTFQPNRADCRGQAVRTQRLAGEQLLLLSATSFKYCNRGAQGSFLLIPLPRPVRSMPGIPWALDPRQSCLHLSFITE